MHFENGLYVNVCNGRSTGTNASGTPGICCDGNYRRMEKQMIEPGLENAPDWFEFIQWHNKFQMYNISSAWAGRQAALEQRSVPKGSSMRIIKRGVIPEEKLYRGTCRKCKTEVEFKARDAVFISTQKDGDSYQWMCPVCGEENYADAHQPQPPRHP